MECRTSPTAAASRSAVVVTRRCAASGEIRREGFDGAGDAVAARAAQFDQILRRGQSDEEAPAFAQDAAEFGGVLTRGDREDGGERAVGVGDEAIGVGDDPLTGGIAARGGFDGGNGDVDAVRIEFVIAREGAEVEAFAAAGIENSVVWRWGQDVRDCAEQRRGYAEVVQAAASCDGGHGVARLLRPALLRLKQVDVSAARHVEGMPAGADQPPLLAHERKAAVADGAEEHS